MIDATGNIQHRDARNPDGSSYPIQLPVLRVTTGVETPCGVCPKVPSGLAKVAANAVEFDGWFWDVFDWYRQCRAVGYPPDLDAVMRQLAAEFLDHDRMTDRAAQSSLILAVLAKRR